MNEQLLSDLTAWVRQQFVAKRLAESQPDLVIQPDPLIQLEPLPGDAGFRRYFRLVNSTPAMLAVYAPPDTEKNTAFVAISEYWRSQNIPAPQVFAVDYEQGFLLVEDFGACSLSDILANSGPSAYDEIATAYAPALDVLLALQTAPANALFEPYDACAQQREMELFCPWFIEALLGYTPSASEHESMQATFDAITQITLKQPTVMVHRDFHCRNIQVRANQRVGLIDFQDALAGPVTYDVVSLLKDCYQQWPANWVEQQALAYRQRLPAPLAMASASEFLSGFDVMGLQRHLKVLGIFARLSLRDGKNQYLHDLPLVIAYVRDICSRYPQFDAFSQWFEHKIMPTVQKQPWYRSVVIQR